MDSDCDYLLYSKGNQESEDCEVASGSCLHCSGYPIQVHQIRSTAIHNTPTVSFEVALTGRMVPYLEVCEATERLTQPHCKLFQNSETPLRYVKDGNIVSLQGAIHMQDVSPNGTWLSEKTECIKSVMRLRLAGLICIHLPELNRIVLEHKNDDGILYLANKWLLNKDNMNEGIELFGSFVCDALLAPVLHEILRSDWIKERKDLGETNNELKLGWAQEFYDWRCLMQNKTGSTVFAHNLKCPVTPNNAHSYRIVTLILDKMRWCGYTPWSAVQAVRCSEGRITKITCNKCKDQLLASCVFLMECAAVEASRQRDWLVRNEAVIQLCWLLYQIHKPSGSDVKDLLEAWTESIMIHSIKFQQYKVKASLSDLEALVVLFANDHLPVTSEIQSHTAFKDIYENGDPDPDPEMVEVIKRNVRFSQERDSVIYTNTREEDFNISTAVDVLSKVSEAMEARAQELHVITKALVSCFPRVAVSALEDLTLQTPATRRFSGRIWPVFVNSTRACYQLFKALALPVSPSPVYTLELLARGWRCITPDVFKRFIPMSTGGVVKVSCEHYMKYFMGPVNTLANLSLISESERTMMIDVLSKGVLPCFAGEGDSIPDRLVSSTVALTFAACGLRVFGYDKDDKADKAGTHRTVTTAGLLYFAAWYVLVYMGTVHIQPILKTKLSQTGSDADKHICLALNLDWVTETSDDTVLDSGAILQALSLVFRDLLNTSTVVRIAELYVPELLVQLPYNKKLNWIPDSVKSAIESRDIWFTTEHGDVSHLQSNEPPFSYLGNLAHGLHSSIKGSLTRRDTRPIAQALHGSYREFDPWCRTLWVCDNEEDSLGVDDTLREAIKDESEEVFLYIDNGEYRERVRSPSSSSESSSSTNVESEASDYDTPVSPKEPEAITYRHICKGLCIESVGEMGFDTKGEFLTMSLSSEDIDTRQRVQGPAVKTPCMANLASTVCIKTPNKIQTDMTTSNHCTLLEALWVLFMHCYVSPCAPPTVLQTTALEPSTPEALAVMVHLAVKTFKDMVTTPLGVCNDIKKMYNNPCHEEQEFIPLAGIVGGLFGVNVELNVNGYNYYILNEHYNGVWAPGSICYINGNWQVMAKSLNVPVRVPREKPTENCYHTGTLCAYIRLNDLKVGKVPSDNYCGFHTVAMLLSNFKAHCPQAARKNMVCKTAKYMTDSMSSEELIAYLGCNTPTSCTYVEAILMEDNRYLSVEEVNFILRAHDKVSAVITETSYPIYQPHVCYYLIHNQHFEPVMHV